MQNSPTNQTPQPRDIPYSLSALITSSIASRGDPAASHEFAALYGLVAKQKEIPRYLGQSPDADYLKQIHRMPTFQQPQDNKKLGILDSKIYDLSSRLLEPSHLKNLASSSYTNERPINLVYENGSSGLYSPNNCSGKYC